MGDSGMVPRRLDLSCGLFDMSIVPNSVQLDPTFKQLQWVGEIEHRHKLWGHPGQST